MSARTRQFSKRLVSVASFVTLVFVDATSLESMRVPPLSTLDAYWLPSYLDVPAVHQIASITSRSQNAVTRRSSRSDFFARTAPSLRTFLSKQRPRKLTRRVPSASAVSIDVGSETDVPDGVVCATWLNLDIQRNNLVPYIERLGFPASDFINETMRLCNGSIGVGADAYTGSWIDHTPTENDVKVLQGLLDHIKMVRKQGRGTYTDWSTFSKPDDGKSLANRVRKVIMKPPAAIGKQEQIRILDYGCGSGTDIVALKHAFGVSTADTLCLDVFKIKREDVTAFTLDTSSEDTYNASLESVLSGGGENSVKLAISMVTFHHISQPKMRRDALNFLSRVLKPGGLFIMAEWDDSVKPSRWIHFDLVHTLSSLFFYNATPSTPEDLRIHTKYLSVGDWRAQAESVGGLVYDASRTLLGNGNTTPQDRANLPLNSNRDFWLVWHAS
eukprot:TRINITY_DN68521_c0_g1_i1.p1 TRINITY_DN68521_c0_g1~~TRINITY_DN68521_c0_g1_i1.p1  ORF type:complete len:443 (+),score=55.38 TRINITY_DN68521_c0_g1_i1:186-1514(+)